MVKLVEKKAEKPGSVIASASVTKAEKRKLLKAERAAEVKENKERKAQERLQKYIPQDLLSQISAHATLPLDEAARIFAKATQGEASAQQVVREARNARRLEARIRLTAQKGGLTVEECRELHYKAHAGDEAAQARIKEIRQQHAEQKTGGGPEDDLQM